MKARTADQVAKEVIETSKKLDRLIHESMDHKDKLEIFKKTDIGKYSIITKDNFEYGDPEYVNIKVYMRL